MDARRSLFAPQLKAAIETLSKLPFLKGSKEAFLALLANILEVRLVEPGQVIAQESEEQTELIVLRKGNAKGVSKDGQEESFSDGSIIGDPAAFHTKLPWALTVTAIDFCDVQVLTVKGYKSVISLHPGEGTRVGKSLERRLSRSSSLVGGDATPRKSTVSSFTMAPSIPALSFTPPPSTPPGSSTGAGTGKSLISGSDQPTVVAATAAAAGSVGEAEVESRELPPVPEETRRARFDGEALPNVKPPESMYGGGQPKIMVSAARRSMLLRKLEASREAPSIDGQRSLSPAASSRSDGGGAASSQKRVSVISKASSIDGQRSLSPVASSRSDGVGAASSQKRVSVSCAKGSHFSLPPPSARGKARKSYAAGMDGGLRGGAGLPAAGARKSIAVVSKLAGFIGTNTATSSSRASPPVSARKSLAPLSSSSSRRSSAALPGGGGREVSARRSMAAGMMKSGALGRAAGGGGTRKSVAAGVLEKAMDARSSELVSSDSGSEDLGTRPQDKTTREHRMIEKMKVATKGILSATRVLSSMSPQLPGINMERMHDQAWEDSHDALHIWAYAMQEDDEASRRELAGWLDKIPFFNRMDAFVFERILPIIKKRAFKRGEYIVEAGKPSEALHVIYAGHANVMSSGSRITSVGPEEVIGERSIANLGSGPSDMPVSAASVVVKTTVLVTIALPRAPLAEIVAKDAWLYRQFEEMYSQQISERGGLEISSMPLFQEADPAFLLQLEISMSSRKVTPGEFVVKEGEALQQAFILTSGTVKIVRESNKAQPVIHTVSGIERAVFLCERNLCGLSFTAPCTIRAISSCMCQIITQDALHKAFDCHPTESWIFRKLVEDADSFKEQFVTASKGSEEHRRGRGALKMRRISEDDALKQSRGQKVAVPKTNAVNSGPASALQRSRAVAIGLQEENSSSSAPDGEPVGQEGTQHERGDQARGCGEDNGDDGASSDSGLSASEAASEAWDIKQDSDTSGETSDDSFGEEEDVAVTNKQETDKEDCDQAPINEEAEQISDDSTASDMEESFAFTKIHGANDYRHKGSSPKSKDRGGNRRMVKMKSQNEEAEPSFTSGSMFQTDVNAGHTLCGTKRVMIMHDLRLIPEFSLCSSKLLHKLESHMRLRLYLPGQIVLRLGEDMGDLYILQRGTCKMEVFNTEMEPVQSPCIIGGMMSLLTPKVVTTVVAEVTSFVATISKHNVANLLDGHPKERKALFSKANQVFSDLCDDFHSRYGEDGLVQRLQGLPLLTGAAPQFLCFLAGVLQPRLLLPGQAIVQESDEVRLFILFEGYCHVLSRDRVVGTISRGMVFGEMEVFGLGSGLEPRAGSTGPITVKTVEFCQVGTISSTHLFSALEDFPEQRPRFEQLVHNRLEESVCAQVSNRPCFEGMPNQLFSKVCSLLERRLCFSSERVVQQGEQGESMIIVNRGKVELFYYSVSVGMLWPGKTFGSPQMLGVERVYHASLLPKTTCHLLLMSKKALNSLATGGAERRWILSLRDQARATLEAELRSFQKKVREQKHMACSGMFQSALVGSSDASRFLGSVFYAWKTYVARFSARGSWRHPSAVMRRTTTTDSIRTTGSEKRKRTKNSALKQHDPEAVARLLKGTSIALEQQQMGGVAFEPPPMNFMRGLRRVQLEDSGEGIVSAATWKPHSQSGRLDVWRSLAAPDWLVAVREEIPSQFMLMKREARGEVISQGLSSLAGTL